VTKSIFAIVCAASFACGALPAVAQNTTPAAFVPVVAVVDLPMLLQNHTRFKNKQEELKRQIQAAEEMVKADQKIIEEHMKRMQEFKPQSPDYKTAEEQAAKYNADLQLKVNIQKRNFAEFRTKAFAEVQDEIANYVYHYALSQGILVVLNFNGEEVDANNPQSVMQALYNPVLYKHPASDITPQILQMINQQLPVAPRPRPTSAQQPGVPETARGLNGASQN
jgi:Skp family chaperone for outer membrane proteins